MKNKLYLYACPCCAEGGIQLPVLDMLRDLRKHMAPKLLRVTSGYRCVRHNAKVGGSPTSSHLKGLAIDVACGSSHERWLILQNLLLLAVPRIGIGKDYIHFDLDLDKAQEVIWVD